jgi:type IX secretion system PorP/SprF family membrane protein
MKKLHHISYGRYAKLVLAFLSVCTICGTSHGQDIHFSQFYQSPFNLNPALTGQFEGTYRFIANQRTQWRSVTTPYSTFGLSADGRNLELPDGWFNKKDGNALATPYHGGVSFYHDKAGDSHLRTTVLNLSAARDFIMGDDPSQRLVPGIMLGLTSMRIDYSELRYDNQWNGLLYDPSINPQENYARSSRSYFNLNMGLAYVRTISKREQITAGIGLFNLSNPKQSFFDDGYVKLDTRINIHANYRFQFHERWLAEPMVNFSTQGTYKEYLVGGLAHYVIEDKSWTYRTLYFGAFGRVKDAGYAVVGMQYDAWNVGISYDINTSNLRPASNGRGGFEFSVVYILPPKPVARPVKVCPDYI